jgi:glutathione S-transferase
MKAEARAPTAQQVDRPAETDGVVGGGTGGQAVPTLWHLKVSNYNEKARWALDYKGVPHLRRAAIPGRHRAIAQGLSGGRTLPVLVLDGKGIGDSTRIIEALELRYPEPALYPADPEQRRLALELEDFFDEELGPHVRLLAINLMLRDAKLMLGAFVPDLTGFRLLSARATFPMVRRQVVSDFAIGPRTVELGYQKIRAAGERFARQRQPSGYLVGDRFTVADLTLAALVAPAVAPEQFPYPQPQRGHPLLAPVRDALAESGLLAWTREMYARHRGASAEIAHGSSEVAGASSGVAA